MEGLIGLIILGWAILFIIRHPIISFIIIFKLAFLLILGFGALITLYWFLLTSY